MAKPKAKPAKVKLRRARKVPGCQVLDENGNDLAVGASYLADPELVPHLVRRGFELAEKAQSEPQPEASPAKAESVIKGSAKLTLESPAKDKA